MKQRANTSVAFFGYERSSRSFRSHSAGFSPIFITAAISVLALVFAVGWTIENSAVSARNTPTVTTEVSRTAPAPLNIGIPAGDTSAAADASSSDPLSQIGPAVLQQLQSAYDQMQQTGTYSSSTAAAFAASLAPYVAAGVSYPAYSAGDVHTDSDTSYKRMLQYRADLRVSLAPLLNNTEPEYEIFAYYEDTKDASYLRKLQQVASDYRKAASSTAQVVVPKDAVSYHVAILNAMEEFAATLDAMATHADDPYASTALLSGYNQAENDMLTSFNSLTTYYKSKQP